MQENPSARPKPKLTAAQQIDFMKRSGVRFDLFPESLAERFLTRRNYFFKVKAFSKNFDRWRGPDGAPGAYMNLDFAYLVELSRLDMHLRSLVLSASLDIEHFLKVGINEAIMADGSCDGYDVVDGFLRYDEARKRSLLGKGLDGGAVADAVGLVGESISDVARLMDGWQEGEPLPDAVVGALDGIRGTIDELTAGIDLHHIEKSIARLGSSSYSRKIARKYGSPGRMAAWNLMELASFGDIISLYKYCLIERAGRKDETAQAVKPLLFPAKTLRNAAAHNSCLMHGLRDRLSAPVGAIAKALRDEYGYGAEEVAATKRVPIVHDLSALLICYDRVVEGTDIRHERAAEMRLLEGRLTRHLDYFSKQPEVTAAVSFMADLLEGFADALEGHPSSS